MLSFLKTKRVVILYGLIGVSAVAVDFFFYLVFYNLFGISPVVSTILSVTVAMVYAFALNLTYNFKTTDLIKSRFVAYAGVSVLGMALSAIVIKVLTMKGVDANLAKAISLPPIVILQYFLNKNYTFRKVRSSLTEGAESTVAHSPVIPEVARTPKRIAIIGGGFTGLTAAYTLGKMGHTVTVYEAEKTLGGLVGGFEVDGLPLEKAYHFLYKTDKHIIDLAHEIGVGEKLHFHASSVAVAYGGKIYPFMTPLDLIRFTPLSFINRIRAGLVAVYLSKVTNWKGFAQVSALTWMRRWCGAEGTRIIWEPVLRGKFFSYFDKIAMSYVWSRVYVRANSKDKGDVTEKLGYFEGGFQTFTKALEEKCRGLGVQFVCETKPEKIVRDGEGVQVVIAGIAHTFDACLATTPSHVFKQLIDAPENRVSTAYLQKLTSIDYLGAVLMVFTTDIPFTHYYWHNVNDPDQPFLVLLSLSALVGPENLHGKHVYYVGAYVPHDHAYHTMPEREIQSLWIDGLKKLFPQFDPKTVTSNHIFKFKNAQHIVEPGYEAKIVPYESELPHTYLANYTQIFPDDRGTNYAVHEGVKVAHLIDQNFRRV